MKSVTLNSMSSSTIYSDIKKGIRKILMPFLINQIGRLKSVAVSCYAKKGTRRSATTLRILIIGLMAGPAVSL